MPLELTRTHAIPRPWGVSGLRPWNTADTGGTAIGEIWYERPGAAPADSSLLLKLLFTSRPLSIQVHPDDAYARSIGLPNGKTEAWYVLIAAPGAKAAVGLKRQTTPQQLRRAVSDGSILDLVAWRTVLAGDIISVPAGTIHAIGAGLVIAEIQQRSDATFRLFDYDRTRELHVERAIAVANTGPAVPPTRPERLTGERTLLLASPYFVFERIDLPPGTAWSLEAGRETWLLVIGGTAAGSFGVAIGDAIFAQPDPITLLAGTAGMAGLVAYTGPSPVPNLLRRLRQPADAKRSQEAQAPPRPRTKQAFVTGTGRRPPFS
jgi:mannose-6-phosphate isomerase